MELQLYFATKTGSNIYKVFLPKSLLAFADFDLSYFHEQCVELCKKANAEGDFSLQEAYVIRNLLKKSHPFFSACIHTVFDKIVTDCMIDYICRAQQLSPGALWGRYISPGSPFERLLFARLSEFRTNKAINQWTNLVRMQGYVRSKLSYVFDGARTVEDAKARKQFFDLSFSIAARELGCPSEDMGAVKVYNPCLLPSAMFLISKLSKDVYRRIAPSLEGVAPVAQPTASSEDLSDQAALDAYGYIKRLPRPADNELPWVRAGMEGFPEQVYVPCGFKSMLDLEFDKILEAGILLVRCQNCGGYFERDINYSGEFCTRKTEGGPTCRELAHSHRKEAAAPIAKTLEERCSEVCALVRTRVGDLLDEREFGEWENYLQSIRRNIEQDYATIEELVAFLDYSERMYGEKGEG